MATAKKNQTLAAAAAKAATAILPGDPAPGMRQVLQVISKRDGFRRAGREWHGTTFVPVQELTREQFEQLLQQIESHLDTLQKKMGELGDQVTDQGQDTLNEINETMVQLRSTTFCDLPFYGPPEQ